MRVDPELKNWATSRQLEIIDAMNEHGSLRKAAAALNVSPGTIQTSLRGLESRATRNGYAPDFDMTKAVPLPFTLKGVSSYYDAEGKLRGQWIKSRIDPSALEVAIREAVDGLMEGVPRAKPVKFDKKKSAKDLCTLYTLTDYHLGMRAWAPEAGEDWDLQIAERVLLSAFDHAIHAAPASEMAILAQLGDYMHFDSLMPVTPTNGHMLDADSRYSKVVGVAVRLLRYIIDKLLAKHRRVVVVVSEGNHDPASAVWLRHLLSLLFEKEPRVEVVNAESPYYAFQFGKTMIAFHHGHLVKKQQLPLIFASRFPEIWGQTTKRYCHTGHQHHVDEKEHPGMKVIQHATLAAADAYNHRSGYEASREITTITYHKKFGQVARDTVCPEMLVN